MGSGWKPWDVMPSGLEQKSSTTNRAALCCLLGCCFLNTIFMEEVDEVCKFVSLVFMLLFSLLYISPSAKLSLCRYAGAFRLSIPHSRQLLWCCSGAEQWGLMLRSNAATITNSSLSPRARCGWEMEVYFSTIGRIASMFVHVSSSWSSVFLLARWASERAKLLESFPFWRRQRRCCWWRWGRWEWQRRRRFSSPTTQWKANEGIHTEKIKSKQINSNWKRLLKWKHTTLRKNRHTIDDISRRRMKW